MKIVYYTYPYFLDVALPFIEEISKLAEVELIVELAPEHWNSDIFDVSRIKKKRGFYTASDILDQNIPVSIKNYWKRCSGFHVYVFNNRRSLHPATWKQAYTLMRILRELKADVIHFDGMTLRIAPFLWLLKRFPIVLNIHDAEPHSGEDNWKKRLFSWLENKHADHFVLHSDFSKNVFVRTTGMKPSRISVVLFGMLNVFHRWTVLKQEQMNTVLFFGRLSPYKGIEILIQSAQLVCDEIPNCRFIIAGKAIPGYKLPNLPQLPRNGVFDIREKFLSHNEIAELMAESTLVACPYLDATQSAVILAAYEFNKPVIVTRVGGLPEYVEEGVTGRIVPSKDPQALATAIISLLSNANIRRQMSENIAGLRETKLSWVNSACETMRIYERVVNEKNKGN
jgi:glycosyltransferase involved in cell wall biosynthesis